jgi:hypothetical protein
MQTCIEKAAAKSNTEFNGAGGLLTYISFTRSVGEKAMRSILA